MLNNLSKYVIFCHKNVNKCCKLASDDVKELNTKEEFVNYYETHKTEIDQQSTCVLNKKFKINCFHLKCENKQSKLIPLNLYRPHKACLTTLIDIFMKNT